MSNITAQDLVRREVLYCVSYMISEMFKLHDHLDSEDQEALIDLQTASRDFEEPAQDAGWEETTDPTWMFFQNGNELRVFKEGTEDEAWEQLSREIETVEDHADDESCQEYCEYEGWELLDSPTFFNLEAGETSEADDWEDLCSEQGIDPHESEAFEHWLVSNWLAHKLTERGYTVRTFMDMTVWARGCTGQAIYCDWVMEDIARSLNRD
ncbi:hypothetical protein [uncultured Halomonas sp.]|uniref:hypothetical protein n=1 Tax=uncultured Halomonas sp. TaxID=173971 RepID=UPI002636608F|nr:hypothetical protein [uncultured Halomonas sp.]